MYYRRWVNKLNLAKALVNRDIFVDVLYEENKQETIIKHVL